MPKQQKSLSERIQGILKKDKGQLKRFRKAWKAFEQSSPSERMAVVIDFLSAAADILDRCDDKHQQAKNKRAGKEALEKIKEIAAIVGSEALLTSTGRIEGYKTFEEAESFLSRMRPIFLKHELPIAHML